MRATLALLWLPALLAATAHAQQTGIRAQPTSYAIYNNVTSAFDTRPEEIVLNANNPPASRYAPIAVPPPAQYSFVQTSDGRNLLSAVVDRATGQLRDRVPVADGNGTFGGLLAARAWNAVDITMAQCYSGGFAWNIQGSLRPSAGVVVANTIPYTFASAANFNELSYAAQRPSINAPPRGADATTALGGFTQGHAWAGWNTAAAPANNTLSRYAAYQAGVRRDPFTAGNTSAAWGNINFFSLATKSFESGTYASSDATLAAGGVNPAAANNARTLAQVAANPTFAVLMAFSATHDNRFVLDLEREYAALRSNGIPANQIAVLYGDGVVNQLGSFTAIAAANRQPDPPGLYGAAFTMPVAGGTSQANVRGLLDGSGWAGLGLAAPPAGARLYAYTTGHGGAVNVARAPAETNVVANGAITTMTLSGPPNPTPKTDLQIASNAPLPQSLFNDAVMVNGHLLPDPLSLSGAPFEIDDFVVPGQGGLYYYRVSVPQHYFDADGNGSYTLSVHETGSAATSNLDAFARSLVAVTMISGEPALAATGAVDTYTVLVVPEPSTALMLLMGVALLLAVARQRGGVR